MSIEVTSTAFQPGATIPKQYTGDGEDRSPPLKWSEPPSETKYSGALKTALIDTSCTAGIIGRALSFSSLLLVFLCVAARNPSPWN